MSKQLFISVFWAFTVSQMVLNIRATHTVFHLAFFLKYTIISSYVISVLEKNSLTDKYPE
jgi:hypothetical protein